MADSFASRLQQAMDDASMTTNRLAKLVGCDHSLISKYLKGVCNAKQIYLNRLAIALNVSEAWLMGLDVEKGRVSSMTPEESELLKMYELLDGAGKARLLAYAIQLIDARKGKD